jgi:hypothetical protein
MKAAITSQREVLCNTTQNFKDSGVSSLSSENKIKNK